MTLTQHIEFPPQKIGCGPDQLADFLYSWGTMSDDSDNDFSFEDEYGLTLKEWEMSDDFAREISKNIYESGRTGVAIEGTSVTFHDILTLIEYWTSNSDGDRICISID
ncbi:MAG: hypothetical protein J6Y37_05860 [Paludibacteraceae bacterium]|nr:hypothetical protein [Paludibacteraceae bacterium]